MTLQYGNKMWTFWQSNPILAWWKTQFRQFYHVYAASIKIEGPTFPLAIFVLFILRNLFNRSGFGLCWFAYTSMTISMGDFIWYQSSYNSNQSESNLRHLNFDPYPSRTQAGPWVTLVATHATMRMSLIFKCPIISIVSELSGFWGVSTIKWNSYPTLL